MRFLRILSLALVLLGVPKVLSAQDRFVFVPQWTAQAQFAGYYAALEQGFYQEEGLDVTILHPRSSQTPDSYILGGRCDATTLPLMQALELIDQGAQFVNILQTSMNSGTIIISRLGKDPREQHGARIGIWRAGHGQLARCFSYQERLDYNWVPLATSVNLFIAGAIDATVAMSYNEYFHLLQAGVTIGEESVLRFEDMMGYNIQEEGVYMTLAGYRRNPARAERFARASRRGWEWVAEHPDEALDIVMRYVEDGHVATNRVMQKMMLAEVLRLQLDFASGEREFRLRPDMVEQASRLMLGSGLIRRSVQFNSLMPR